MVPMDLLHLESCNLDPLTETYNNGFYLEYLAKWPHLCQVMEGRTGIIEGYSKFTSSTSAPLRLKDYRYEGDYTANLNLPIVLGKVEASPHGMPTKEPYSPNTNKNMDYLPWHAHITALTVAPSCRRLGHARRLSALLEQKGDSEKCWFVDLFVRKDNKDAIALYKSMG